jgi:hypothetical protein
MTRHTMVADRVQVTVGSLAASSTAVVTKATQPGDDSP